MRHVKVKFWKKSNDFFQLDKDDPNRIVASIFPKTIVPEGNVFFVGFRGKDVRGWDRKEILRIISKAGNNKTCYIDIIILRKSEDPAHFLNPKTKVSLIFGFFKVPLSLL